MIYYITSLGLIPMLASRAVLPIFSTALVARFGPEFYDVAEYAGIELVAGLPAWMTSDIALVILGLGALLEVGITKSPELRQLLEVSESGIRGFVAFFLCFHLVEGDFNELVDIILSEGPTTSYVWGNSFAYSWSFGMGWLVYMAAALRGQVMSTLSEADDDDVLGFQGLWSWMEDIVAMAGPLLVFVLPVAALTVAGITLLGLYLFKRWLVHREEKKKVPCSSCSHPNHACATVCPNCGFHHATPMAVGFMGIIQKVPATDPKTHAYTMRACKRCVSCGERLKERRVDQSCQVCGFHPFASQRELNEYLAEVRASLPKTMAISAAFGLIPIIGLIPGIIYYRASLIAGLRAYIPSTTGCLSRWLVRLVIMGLIAMQWTPGLGALTLPLMCFINYSVYSAVLKQQGVSKLPVER